MEMLFKHSRVKCTTLLTGGWTRMRRRPFHRFQCGVGRIIETCPVTSKVVGGKHKTSCGSETAMPHEAASGHFARVSVFDPEPANPPCSAVLVEVGCSTSLAQHTALDTVARKSVSCAGCLISRNKATAGAEPALPVRQERRRGRGRWPFRDIPPARRRRESSRQTAARTPAGNSQSELIPTKFKWA